ncbi:MAG: rRNA pseudouridine synthase [Anaerolineales bacterium]|nr:rRNA pseudouridine synthase [Anaerolineales bacterium]
MEERLQKILAQAGIGSRRSCEKLIQQRLVTVNGKTAVLGQKADLGIDTIAVKGQRINGEEEKVYIALYKPRGVLSTVKTPEDVKTVLDMVDHPARLYPVGRLDRDSEGLILLTNDGDLAYQLSHPRFGHEKTYRVLVARQPEPEMLEAWRSGVEMPDGYKTKPVQVDIAGTKGRGVWLNIRMKEGRKRQIREMARSIGLPVVSIKRVQIGPLKLGGLKPGEWRVLTQQEKQALLTSVRGTGVKSKAATTSTRKRDHRRKDT